jgi:hypothetical protein
VDVSRVVQKWQDQQPVETIVLEPGQKFPDIQKLNEETSRGEWTTGPDGSPRGPWQALHIAYLLNPATMERFTFATGTTGGAICVRDVVDRTKWMRRYRGAHVYPVVTLSDTFMNTRFGGRQRPHFIIKLVSFGGSEEPALPAPNPPAAPQLESSATNKPTEKVSEPGGPTMTMRGVQHFDKPATKTVAQPTLKEQLNDEIPF